MIMRCLMAYNQGLAPSDPQTKIERVQNAQSDSAQASSNLNEERAGFDMNTRASYNLANWQGLEAQHPMGPFIAESSSHDTVPANTGPPHPTVSILFGSDELLASRDTDQSGHAMFWGAQEVSCLEYPGASTLYGVTDLMISSRRQCTMGCRIQ